MRFVKSLAFALALGLTSVVVGSATPASAGVVDAVTDVANTPNQCVTAIQVFGPAVGTVGCAFLAASKPVTFVFHVSGHGIEFVGQMAGIPGACLLAIEVFGPAVGAVGCVFVVTGTTVGSVLGLI